MHYPGLAVQLAPASDPVACSAMIPLETCSVSRKTPRDGKLEIRPETADRLRQAGALTLTLGDRDAPAAVVSMPCTCGKSGGAHEHQFLESEPLRSLVPSSPVALSLDPEAGRILARPEGPG